MTELEQTTEVRTVIAFSLNHFTEINETKGRYQANILMQRIARRISEKLGKYAKFYRLDGTRYLAIFEPGLSEPVTTWIEQIRSIVDQEYKSAHISVRIPASFGVISYPDQVDTPQSLVDHAMLLITAAKENTEEDYLYYAPQNIQAHREYTSVAMELGRNVLNGMKNFRIVIQPVVEAQTGRPVGGEVLMRWKHNGRDVPPGIFVPILERRKNIGLAGKWVFEQTVLTCRHLVSYNPDFYLTFNVSYHQIKNDEFLAFIQETLKKYQLSGRHLVAELTEMHFDESPEKLRHFVQECQKMNIRIALDDFGNGYSSLGLLLKYPANLVKLDRSLLMEMSQSEDNQKFIGSIVYACHQFGKKVCMEGVETEEQNAMIQACGCDLIQGYYHYRPMEVEDMCQLLDRQ